MYVEKNDLKAAKNRFFRKGFLTTFREPYFSTRIIENNSNKVYIAKK